MVKDNEEHGCGAEEDGKSVEIIVGNHLDCRFRRIRLSAWLWGMGVFALKKAVQEAT